MTAWARQPPLRVVEVLPGKSGEMIGLVAGAGCGLDGFDAGAGCVVDGFAAGVAGAAVGFAAGVVDVEGAERVSPPLPAVGRFWITCDGPAGRPPVPTRIVFLDGR